MKTVKITKKDFDFSGYNEEHQCHFNAYNYMLDFCDDTAYFVCCRLNGVSHCIVKVENEDGYEYIDPTLNRDVEVEIVEEFSFNNILDIFDNEGMTFNPAEWTYKEGKMIKYEGYERIEKDFAELVNN